MGAVLNYADAAAAAMAELAADPRTIFVGQSVAYDGQAMFPSFAAVPMERRIEMPVAEDFQLGMCTGLALQGFIPVCFYPRMDFFIIATNQLVNHLDKMPLMGGFRPKVIMRTAVGRSAPLDPGPQHVQNHVGALRAMLHTVRVMELGAAEQVVPGYREALAIPESVVVVEQMQHY